MVRIEMDPFVRRYQPDRWDDWRRGLDRAPHPEDDRTRRPASSRSPGASGSASAAPSRRPSLALSTASEIPAYSSTAIDSASASASSSSATATPKPKARKRARKPAAQRQSQSGKKARAGRRPRAVSAVAESASASEPSVEPVPAPVSSQLSTDTTLSLPLPLDSPLISKTIADSDTSFASPDFLSIADLVKLYSISSLFFLSCLPQY